jgi:hypothetical protein
VTEIGDGRAVIAERAPSVTFVGVEGDRALYEVGSGRYEFRVAGGLKDPSP